MTCPKCSEPRAHRSHRSGFADWAMGMVQRTPYRCHACGRRFDVFRHGETSPKLRAREEVKIMQLRRRLKWKRSKRVLFAFGLGSVLLIALLYYLMQQRIGPDG